MKRSIYMIICIAAGFALNISCSSGPVVEEAQTVRYFKVEEPSFPDKQFDIRDFGARKGGKDLNTKAINDAIAACSHDGGGRVIVPAGVWLTGPVELMNDVNLHLDEGSVLLFSSNFDDYPYVYSYFEGQRDYRAKPMVYGDSLENIAITGKGALDGSGQAWRPVKRSKCIPGQWSDLVEAGGVLDESGNTWWPNEYALKVSKDPGHYRKILADLPDKDAYKAFYRPALVQLISCKKVLLEGPLFQNSPAWCIHPLMCEHLTVRNIVVKNPWFAQNGDGIDVESCQYVSIKDSQFDVGDDAICIKSGKDEEGRARNMPTRYLEVDNCIVHHGHGGFVVGSEMSGGVSDIWVRNCTFLGTDVGLRFKSTRGRGGIVENIHIEDIRMINIDRDAIIFNLFYAGLAPTEMGENPIEAMVEHAPEVSEETPEFRNIHIKDVVCQGGNRAIQILGLPEMPVSGLVVENSAFTTTYGIECTFAAGIGLENVEITTDGHPGMKLVNVIGVDVRGFTGNNDTLYHIDGSGTRDVKIHAAGLEKEDLQLYVAPSVDEGEVFLEN